MSSLMLLLAIGFSAQNEPLPISLEKAVEIALAPEGNLRLAIVRESIAQADSRRLQAKAAFLPQLDGSIGASSQTRNLAAFGFRFPPLPVPGFSVPSFVGPFTVVDYRATATQSILDLSAIRRYSATKLQLQASEADAKAAREQTIAQIARLYTQALRAEAFLATIQSNLALADRLVQLAQSQKDAGSGTGIEVTRARVEAQNSRLRLLDAEVRLRRAHLELKRALHLDFSRPLQLTSRVNDGTEAPPDPAAAVASALNNRADLVSIARRKAALEMQQRSIAAERYPTLGAAADYGSIGDGTTQLPTRSVGVALRVPLFDGGRREARRAEAGIALRQETLRELDLRAQIELEVLSALDNWRVSREQIGTARQGLDLAEQEIAQAERRLAAGVSLSVEITDAQARLERARDNHLNALYQFNLARIDLAAATGILESSLKSTLAEPRN